MRTTTITVDRALKSRLDKLKRHSRESYNDVVGRLLSRSIGEDVDVEALLETIAILSDPEIMQSLARGVEDLKNGQVCSIDEV